MDRENFPSYIPADKDMPELTVRAILIGMFLAVVLGAANAYLGLYAGMTVSAIIPGAVIALGILRPFKPTILEVNIATMGASAGECIAAGVIFTIPALLLLGTWSEINYLQTTIISLIGGMQEAFRRRRALVVAGTRALPGLELVEPEGAFYIFPDVSSYFGKGEGSRLADGHAVKSSDDFAEFLLDEARVLKDKDGVRLQGLLTLPDDTTPGEKRLPCATSESCRKRSSRNAAWAWKAQRRRSWYIMGRKGLASGASSTSR